MKQPRSVIAALTVFVTIAGSSLLYGSSKYSQKTYLSGRAQGVNSAMEYSLWHNHPYAFHPLIRTNLQVVPFFQHSQNGSDTGRYFGIGNKKNNFTVGLTTGANPAEIDKDLIIHSTTEAGTANGLKGTVAFLPEQEVYGARIDYFQDLSFILRHFFFSAHTALVHVSNNMGLRVKNSAPAAVEVVPAGANPATETNFTLEDFFSGKVVVLDATSTNLQLPLCKAKIAGKRTAAGFADIELRLGYKAYRSDCWNLYFSLDGLLPTGNTVRGEYAFEPIYGNGRHFGFGGSVDFNGTLLHTDTAQLRLLLTGHYKYLFEETEHRTLGLQGVPFGQYFLTGKHLTTATPLVPAANILTLPLRVRPGNMVDSSLAFSLTWHRWVIDLGYNVFWRERETVHIKQDVPADTYAIAASSFPTNAQFNMVDVIAGTMTAQSKFIINLKNLGNLNNVPTTTTSIVAPQTPSLLTHKLFTGLGYNCHVYDKYLCTVGIGGSYEFANSNADIENFAIWAKANFSF